MQQTFSPPVPMTAYHKELDDAFWNDEAAEEAQQLNPSFHRSSSIVRPGDLLDAPQAVIGLQSAHNQSIRVNGEVSRIRRLASRAASTQDLNDDSEHVAEVSSYAETLTENM